jgi:peptide-methionine (S)-S-oxide reductase
VEAAFRKVNGVADAAVGYAGGKLKNPTYKDVCTDRTGHAEVVQVEFDPEVVSYEELLKVFWEIHDPTQLNRQGPDFGAQYRSVIFYHNEKQRKLAMASKEKIQRSGKFQNEIVTEIIAAPIFYRAEEYHQRYHEKHGIDSCRIG